MWVLLCAFRWQALENEFSQIVQLKIFLPVWVLLWILSLLGVWNFLSQVTHLCSMAFSGLGITGVSLSQDIENKKDTSRLNFRNKAFFQSFVVDMLKFHFCQKFISFMFVKVEAQPKGTSKKIDQPPRFGSSDLTSWQYLQSAQDCLHNSSLKWPVRSCG